MTPLDWAKMDEEGKPAVEYLSGLK